MTVSTIEFQLRSSDATWCYEKWEQLPDDGNRYEVIDGVLYRSTSPGFEHQEIVWNLVELIGTPLKRASIVTGGFAPIGLLMLGADPVQPDFVLVRWERRHIITRGRISGVPDLIAEVLSPNNPTHDTVIKRGLYARAGVPEYWIIHREAREVLVLTQPDASLSEYAESRRFTADMDLVSPTLPITVSVAALFHSTAGDAEG